MIIKKTASKFVPNVTDPLITAFEKVIMTDLKTLESSRTTIWKNLPWQERKALRNLAKDLNIIIKEADKGGGVVILDRDVYIQEVNRQLLDTEFYREINFDPTKKVQELIRTVLIEGTNLGYITEDMAGRLTVKTPHTPIFYILPKIHKPGFPPKGRPIISGNDSPP